MKKDSFQPKPEHKFTFGLWTVGNRGRDPFGDFVRPLLSPNESGCDARRSWGLRRELSRQRSGAD